MDGITELFGLLHFDKLFVGCLFYLKWSVNLHGFSRIVDHEIKKLSIHELLCSNMNKFIQFYFMTTLYGPLYIGSEGVVNNIWFILFVGDIKVES